MTPENQARIAGLSAALASLTLVSASLPETSGSHVLATRLMLFPVLAGALWFGWRGGLVCGLLSIAGIALADTMQGVPAISPESLQSAAILLATGIAVGAFTAREHHRAAEYRRVVEELRAAHHELKENFEGMKRAERLFAVGQLSAGLAHEIRNPLASLSGAAGILRRSPEATAKQTELLAIIERECQRLNRLLTNFLDFARPRPPNPRLTAIEPVLDAVIGLASHAIGRKNIAIRKELEPGLPVIECDSEQLQQVLLNMVINSIQASEDGDAVVLAARSGQDRIWLEVRDQGCGVKPEHVDRLFDPFFTTKEHGTGLGLPVAHEIVRSIGGVLRVGHNADRGMTFSVGLPMERKGIALGEPQSRHRNPEEAP